jgi:dihydroneopterin aldolase
MKYQTAVTGLEFFAYHGLYEEEKVIGAIFYVDVLLEMEMAEKVVLIDQALNYVVIYNTAREEMANRQDLIETVAQNILERLTAAFPRLETISVTIRKPNPAGLFGSGTASVTFSA